MNDARRLFEVPGPGAYLLAHSVGCLPVSARNAIDTAFFAPWAAQGANGWASWLDATDGFRAAIANLMGARAELVCPQPSVTAALFSLLSGLPCAPDKNVLVASRHAFPSIGFAMRQCERLGYRLKLIDGDPAAPSTWLDAIDDQVAAVVAMHVHSNSGLLSPITAIAERARTMNAISIIDVAQSVGILPIDVGRWGVDALVGSCVKWLCGGTGAGFLWASAELVGRSAPLNVGWFSHADPFAFDIGDFRYAPDARRFWGGTPSIAPYVVATAAIATIATIGVPGLLAHNRRLIDIFAKAADANLDMRARGGTLCLKTARSDALATALTEAAVRFDRREDVIRISFHIWNEPVEAALVGAIARDFEVWLA